MLCIDTYILKKHLAVKIAILQMKLNSGSITGERYSELISLYQDYEKNGATIEELKLLFDDVCLALED